MKIAISVDNGGDEERFFPSPSYITFECCSQNMFDYAKVLDVFLGFHRSCHFKNILILLSAQIYSRIIYQFHRAYD